MTQPRITLEQLGKQFAAPDGTQTAVLDHVSLHVETGEFVCLLGPSGCGKSTILNLVAGFEQPDSGRVLLNGQPVAGPGPERGMVFQQPTLFPWLTVRDNITFGPRMAGSDQAVWQAEAERYLQLVGLQDFAGHYPWQLSGGMRQRAALARAWLPQPQTLLMDEPFGALDAQTRLVMQELLTDIWQRTGTTILFVTHDVDEALFLADRVLVMSARPGRIRASFSVPFARPRSPEELLTNPAYSQLKREVLHIVREEAAKSLASQPALI